MLKRHDYDIQYRLRAWRAIILAQTLSQSFD